MTEATTRLYFDAPVEQVDTGTARLACRRYGNGPPLLVHEEKPAAVARTVLDFLG